MMHHLLCTIYYHCTHRTLLAVYCLLFTVHHALCHHKLYTLGSKVHDSDRQSYGESYGPGDVVGCSLTMNEDPSRTRLCFYKNGVSQGVAYSGAEVPLGVYFPAVSLYMDVSTLTALCLTYVI
jgi:hypothetical protein